MPARNASKDNPSCTYKRVMPVRRVNMLEMTIRPGWICVAGEEINSRRVDASRDNPSWTEWCGRRGDLL
jgi:hypothetical protein